MGDEMRNHVKSRAASVCAMVLLCLGVYVPHVQTSPVSPNPMGLSHAVDMQETPRQNDDQAYANWSNEENSESHAQSSIEADQNVYANWLKEENSESQAQSSVESDQNLYANWLKDENSVAQSSIEADQNNQISIRAYRRSGGGSGSGSGSGATLAPTKAPTKAPSTAPSAAPTVAATTVNINAPNIVEAKQTMKAELTGGAAAFTGQTKASTTCGIGVLADTMTRTCAHKTGTETVVTAADDQTRRGAVVLTVIYYIDPA